MAQIPAYENVAAADGFLLAARFFVPAEAVVALTGNASAGVATYGVLHFGAPGLGLLATFVADQSRTRMFFAFACLATAGLNPLVFGFPTEMWAAHALFWPTLAVCHDAGPGPRGGRRTRSATRAWPHPLRCPPGLASWLLRS